jgi:helix-turn-helix protein
MKTQIEDGSTAETSGHPSANVRSEQLRDRFGLLSPDDLSALIGADPRTLAIWRATGKGPDFTKAGRAVYYRRTDIDAWLALNVVPMDRAA